MCGIVGGINVGRNILHGALETIAHRGYDAVCLRGYERRLWLGHRRLAIQDLSPGADQPYESATTALVFNGELWRRNLDSYKALRGAGKDTELLSALYTAYGADPVAFAQRLDGMFAFAIYDQVRGRLVLARDMMGRIPLYYTMHGGRFAFASEAKALVRGLGLPYQAPGRKRRAIPDEVKLFPPGTVMTYDIRSGKAKLERFAGLDRYAAMDYRDIDTSDQGLDYYTSGLLDRLTKAVYNEMVADVPICTILSGGIDSTIITYLLSKLAPGIRAYTVSVGQSNGKDDLAYARLAAKELNVDLVEVILYKDEVAFDTEETVWAVEDDRWVQVAPAVPQIALARRIGQDGYKVVFGGEGSDELFGSYGDVRRWSWRPEQYHRRRVELCMRLHDNNVIRGNKAMMYGGTVELRTPFLDREVIDFCLRIPSRYRANKDGKGNVLKPVLREAFRGRIGDKLLMRPKVTFQEGAHSDFLKEAKSLIKETFARLFDREV